MKNLDFIKYCNEQIYNTNEYNIAKVILDNINIIENLSLEKIAEEANISIASVSRFINNAGFKNFTQFKYEMKMLNKDLKMRRIISHTERFMRTSIDQINENIFDDGIKNLYETKKKLSTDKLKEIIKLMKSYKRITFIGDTHELADFYTLQIDLLVNDLPAFFFNINEINKFQIHSYQPKEDLIIYLDVHHEWFIGNRKEILLKLKNKKIPILAFAQEAEHLINIVDYLYLYGIKNSVNDGYYSLFYISRILSELIYIK